MGEGATSQNQNLEGRHDLSLGGIVGGSPYGSVGDPRLSYSQAAASPPRPQPPPPPGLERGETSGRFKNF